MILKLLSHAATLGRRAKFFRVACGNGSLCGVEHNCEDLEADGMAVSRMWQDTRFEIVIVLQPESRVGGSWEQGRGGP